VSGEPLIQLWIPGEPIPASRPRVTKWGTFNSKRYSQYKQKCALMLQAAYRRRTPIGMAVAVSIEVVIPRPKSRPRSGLAALYWLADQDYPAPVGGCWGDIDNYIKGIFDAAQMAGVIANDSQVVEVTATKHAGDQPGVYVQVSIVHPD
jgi:Holliday junction resolvase RusA-like endonuclease